MYAGKCSQHYLQRTVRQINNLKHRTRAHDQKMCSNLCIDFHVEISFLHLELTPWVSNLCICCILCVHSCFFTLRFLSAIVMFKLSNFNSVTVIISYWFLSFSYQMLQLMCQFQFKLQLQLTVTKSSELSFSYTEGNFQFQFQLMSSGKNEPWDACL